MSALEWGPLVDADLPELTEIARSCLRRDGGLPQLASEQMLRRYFLSDEGIGGRDETGELVAAAGLSWDGQGRRMATGLVHPSLRRQGHGDALVQWCREHAGAARVRVVAETMSLEAEELFARSGLTRTFAETVMRHRLRHIPRIALPTGLRVLPFDATTAPAFHTAYRRSFAERPGFPDTPQAEWIELTSSEEGFRPADSRVALDERGEPAGFVDLVDNWIDQVGVVPEWRGRGLGAHLVARSLTVFKKSGEKDAWLAVNVDNPARNLYERLGFHARGTRARYEDRVIPSLGPSA